MTAVLAWIALAWVKLRRAVWEWDAEHEHEPMPAANASKERCALGVVLSGGEFTPGGSYPVHYGYPTTQSIDYYASKGMKIIRLPFLWERVQPVQFGFLDPVEISRIAEVVRYATAKGFQVGLDVHNGGYGYGSLIGGASTTDSSFADLWSKLATAFKDNPSVVLMLMSEPSDQSATQWLKSANAAIAAIRKAGSTQTIVVPGSYYDKAMTWTDSDNARVVGAGVVDPLNNYLFEVHAYLDADGSGGSAVIVSPTIGVERLVDATVWARKAKQKFFIGEFATANDTASLTALDNMLIFIQHNADVWAYATWWGAGDRWQNYMFGLDPVDYAKPVDKPQMVILEKYL